MHHIIYPHQSPFRTLADQATRSYRTTNQTAATNISSTLSYPRASSIIPLAQKARAESQHGTTATTSAPAPSPKKRTFGDFARGEKVEVAREDVEMVDAPPVGQTYAGQRITVSDVLPSEFQNRNIRPIVFKSAAANARPSLSRNAIITPTAPSAAPVLRLQRPRPSPFGTAKVTPAAPLAAPVLGLQRPRPSHFGTAKLTPAAPLALGLQHPRPPPFGTAKVTPAAQLATPVLGLQLTRRHWSVEPTEEWVVQPQEVTTPAAWPQKVLYSGVYFVGTVAAFSTMKIRAIATGGWRSARALHQNRGQIRQECTMAVVTGYNSAKRRLVTLRRRAIPAQLLGRRQFDPVVEINGRAQEDAMEDVRSTDEVFVTPPTTRYSTPEESLNQAEPSLPADTHPRTYWASDRGFRMGERRGPRRPSEDSDVSELDEYLWDEGEVANIERVEEFLASPIWPHIPVFHLSPSPVFKGEPDSAEWPSSASSEGEVIFPSIETDEATATLPSPTTRQDGISPPTSPTPDSPADGYPRLSTTPKDTRIIEEAQPRESRQPLQPSPQAPATEEATETAGATPRRDLANGISEGEMSAYLKLVTSLGRKMASQKEGERPKYHAFDPAFYTSLRKKGAKGVKTQASEGLIIGRQSTLFDVEQVFIPVLTGKHWSLLVVSFTAKTISYYDSLGGSARPHIRLVKLWLAEELGKAYRERDWSTPSGSRGAGPRLAHRADCGVIACMTARMLVLGRDPIALDCSAEAIGSLRTGMKAELSGGVVEGGVWT